MEMFAGPLALCEGNPWITSGVPQKGPVKWSIDISFDVNLNLLLNEQQICQWSDMPCGAIVPLMTSL